MLDPSLPAIQAAQKKMTPATHASVHAEVLRKTLTMLMKSNALVYKQTRCWANVLAGILAQGQAKGRVQDLE